MPISTSHAALLVAATAAFGLVDATPGSPVRPDYRWADPAAVERWHDMKFGLRIHWGMYAITAIGPESWPLNAAKGNQTFLNWYWNQAKTWQPAKYDPDAWITLMKRAGITFFDFTTKHHEGFSMYDTNTRVHDCWDFDLTPGAKHVKGIKPCVPAAGLPDPAGPAAAELPPDGIAFSSMEAFGRDITGELVTAARKGGIIPGLYFSNIDWFDPDMRIDQWNAVAASGHLCDGMACDPKLYNASTDPAQWRRFVLRHRAQVLEVLTKYGEICEASFDMDFPAQMDEDITDTFMLARQLAPNTLFRGRGMGGKKQDGGYGDYDTPEETFPDKPVPGNWQVIYHGSAFMSYDPDPSHYVNGSFIIWHLVDVVAKGGLMQIGYGPDKDGEFHPLAVQALELAGDWLAVNGQAIYATRSMPVHWNDTKSDYVRYTRSKDNTTIFAIALTGFGGPDALAVELTLSCVEPVAGSSIYLLGQNASAVKWRQDKATGLTTIQVPAAAASLPGPGYSFKITGKPSDRC